MKHISHILFAVAATVYVIGGTLAGPIETKGGRFIVTDPVTGEVYSSHTLEQKAIETAAALSEELGGVKVEITREPVEVRYTGPAAVDPPPAHDVTPPPATQPSPSASWIDPPTTAEPGDTLAARVVGVPEGGDVVAQGWDATAETVVPLATLTGPPWEIELDLLPGRHEVQLWVRDAQTNRVSEVARHTLTLNGIRPPPPPAQDDPPLGDAGDRVIYVSSSGGHDEENTGLSPQLAFKTVARAMREVWDGNADTVLFKTGDTWRERVGDWRRSGRSADEPITLGYYGSGPRPIFDVDRPFIEKMNRGQGIIGNFRVVGLHVTNSDRDPNRPGFTVDDARVRCAGINWLAHFENITIEDCIFEYFSDGFVFTPIRRIDGQIDTNYRGNGLTLRRNIIRNNYATWIGNNSGKSQGVYIDVVWGFVAEENFFFRNGWHPDVQESVRNRFNHNIYMNTRTGPGVIRGNILASAGSHGAQMRGGGVFEDNVVIDSPLAAFVTASDSAMRRNAVLYSPVVTTDEMADGVGLQAFGLDNVDLSYNVIAQLADTDSRPRGRPLEANDNVRRGTMTANVVFNWPGTVRVDNDVQQNGNLFSPNANQLIDPTRDLAAYEEHLGGDRSRQDFFDRLHNRPMGVWYEDRTGTAASRWIREGYEPAPFD
ncbi:MAG: hypothetical protein AAF797_17650 [Planctomycetota bacterium]